MSGRDWAPLFTGRKMGNSLISLVSFNTADVVATTAAFRVALVATSLFSALARCGAKAPKELLTTRLAASIEAVSRARNRLIRFDIVRLSLL